MAVEYPAGQVTSYLAGANLTTAMKYRLVKPSTTAGRVELCTAGSAAIGVMLEGATTGAAVAVMRAPARAKVTAGATITAGAALASDASGQAVPATANQSVVGWAESASATSGLVTVTLGAMGGTA